MAGDEHLTIDELARRTGMTVRNLRAHQSRGLMSPPEVRGRVGYYGPEHVARVELIKELQADGFSLELIKRLIDQSGGSSADVLRFTRALHEAFVEEEPEIVSLEDLAERFGADKPKLLEKALRLGLLRDLGDGRYEDVSPRLSRAGMELDRLGIPPDKALDVVARLRRHADSVAHTFVALFLDAVWKPFDEEGRPADRWPEVADALDRLRPLAGEAVMATFQIAMADAVETAFGREMNRATRGPEQRPRARRS
jgi:DNA-binding transcriptional MerR regulator